MAITHALEGGSSVQDQLGTGHVVAGKVTATAGTDAVCTCNDKSVVLTRTATGDYTLTFGEPFIVAPYVSVIGIFPTYSTLTALTAQLVSVATDAVRVNMVLNTTSGTVTALSDQDFHFHIVGKRYN